MKQRDLTTSGFHSRLEFLVEDNDFAVASFDKYVLLVWRKNVTVTGAQAFSHLLERVQAARPQQQLGFITLLEATCDPSTNADVRMLMSATLRSHSARIAAAAIVYEREGFWSAVLRSVITAINLASRTGFPNKVTEDLQHGISFVTDTMRDSSETRWQSLHAALDSMRSQAFGFELPR